MGDTPRSADSRPVATDGTDPPTPKRGGDRFHAVRSADGDEPTAASGCESECEAALLHRIAAGDEDAFRALHARTVDRFTGVALGLVRERAVAEDAVQEAYLTIWRRASTFDPAKANAIVWMLLIVRGKAIDLIRRRGSHAAAIERLSTSGLLSDKASGLPPEQHAPPLARRAREALSALPSEQREVLLLAFQGGMSGAEISAYRDLPLGTVKTRIRQGLIRLRAAVGQRSDHP